MDWLYGITKNHPGGTNNTIVSGANEAEDLLSMYHLVTWEKSLGGAGITPGKFNSCKLRIFLMILPQNSANGRRSHQPFHSTTHARTETCLFT